MASIGVYVRFRPLSAKELAMDPNLKTVPFKFPNEHVVHDLAKKKDYAFDRAFPMNTTQQQVYDLCAEPLLEKCMSGYNGTLLAYGQTGAGKTFTMEGGGDATIWDQRGVIPRIVKDISMKMFVEKSQIDFHLSVSMLQIYKELIDDLLEPHKHDLKVHEMRGEGFFIKDLTEQTITDPQQILDALTLGTSNRATASTNMNKVSSRSHSVFILNIKQVNTMDGSIKKSKLVLVDLAGSERVGKTDAKGERLEEAKAINKSLSVLGNVINALTEKTKSHIPYRDSTLTKLLMNSLGGNSMTSLIIACSPASYNYEESVSTLQFGIRAKMIKNAVKLNITRSAAELERLLNLAENEIRRLKSIISFYEKGEKPPAELLVSGLGAEGLGETVEGLGSGPSTAGGVSTETGRGGKKGGKKGAAGAAAGAAGYRMEGSLEEDDGGLAADEEEEEDRTAVANGDIKFLKERKDALRRELDILQIEFAEMNSQKQEIEVQLKMNNNKMIDLLRELDTYKSTDLIRENMDLKTHNQILRDQLDKSTLAYSEVFSELKLRREQSENADCEGVGGALSEDLYKLKKDLQNLKSMYQQLEEENQIIASERDAIARQLTTLTSGLDSKIERAVHDDQYYEKLVLEKQTLEKKIQKEKEKSSSDRQSLLEIQKGLQAQIKDLQKKQKEAEAAQAKRVAALEKDLAKQKRFAEEARAQSGLKRDDLVALLQGNLDDALRDLERAGSLRDDAVEARDALEKRLETSKAEITRLKEEYSTLASDVSVGAAQGSRKRESELNRLQSSLDTLRGEKEALESSLQAAEDRVRSLESALSDQEVVLRGLEGEKARFQEQYQQSARQCDRLNRVLRGTGKDDVVARLQKEIDDLNRQFTDYRLERVHDSEISAIQDVMKGQGRLKETLGSDSEGEGASSEGRKATKKTVGAQGTPGKRGKLLAQAAADSDTASTDSAPTTPGGSRRKELKPSGLSVASSTPSSARGKSSTPQPRSGGSISSSPGPSPVPSSSSLSLSEKSFGSSWLFSDSLLQSIGGVSAKLTPNNRHLGAKGSLSGFALLDGLVRDGQVLTLQFDVSTSSTTDSIAIAFGVLSGVTTSSDLSDIRSRSPNSYCLDLARAQIIVGGTPVKREKEKEKVRSYTSGSPIELTLDLKSSSKASCSIRLGSEELPKVFSSGLKSPCAIGFYFDGAENPRVNLSNSTLA